MTTIPYHDGDVGEVSYDFFRSNLWNNRLQAGGERWAKLLERAIWAIGVARRADLATDFHDGLIDAAWASYFIVNQ